MSPQGEADDNLRAALASWLEAHDRGGEAGELLADFVAVAQFRSYSDDETCWDRYEPIAPAGTAVHSAKGLLAHGLDVLVEDDTDEDD